MEGQLIFKMLVLILPNIHSLPQNFKNAQTTSLKCSSYNTFGYFCVPYYQCDNNGHIITDGDTLIGPRRAGNDYDYQYENEQPPHHQDALHGTCSQLLEVCCLLVDPDRPITPPVSLPSQPQCGRHNDFDFSVRQTDLDKDDTTFAEWPHVCAILKDVDLESLESSSSSLPVYQCTGSIIAKGVILTAAHCVHNHVDREEGRLKVRCGEWDTQNEGPNRREPKTHQDIYVETVIVHPGFVRKNLWNNFALLITERDFVLDDHIYPVCLPSPGDMLEPEECVANGWGKDKFGNEGRYQPILKEVSLGLVDQRECQRRLRETRLGRFFQLHDTFICAGGEEGLDTCKGDGGGPLACRHGASGPWVQTGIVSWGIGCGDDIPAVYARVSKAVCWIDQILRCYFDTRDSVLGYPIEDCEDNNSVECSIFNFANPRIADSIDPEKEIFGDYY